MNFIYNDLYITQVIIHFSLMEGNYIWVEVIIIRQVPIICQPREFIEGRYVKFIHPQIFTLGRKYNRKGPSPSPAAEL